MFTRRLLATLAFFGFLGAAVVLLLSDRAGASFNDVLSSVINAGRAIERDSGIDLIDRSDIPGRADQIGHAVFWGLGMMLIGWITRRRVPLLLTGLVVGGLSISFELAQPALSQTRVVEATDAAANLVGIATATVVLFIVTVGIRLVFGDDRRFYGDQVHPRLDDTDEMYLPFR